MRAESAPMQGRAPERARPTQRGAQGVRACSECTNRPHRKIATPDGKHRPRRCRHGGPHPNRPRETRCLRRAPREQRRHAATRGTPHRRCRCRGEKRSRQRPREAHHPHRARYGRNRTRQAARYGPDQLRNLSGRPHRRPRTRRPRQTGSVGSTPTPGRAEACPSIAMTRAAPNGGSRTAESAAVASTGAGGTALMTSHLNGEAVATAGTVVAAR